METHSGKFAARFDSDRTQLIVNSEEMKGLTGVADFLTNHIFEFELSKRVDGTNYSFVLQISYNLFVYFQDSSGKVWSFRATYICQIDQDKS